MTSQNLWLAARKKPVIGLVQSDSWAEAEGEESPEREDPDQMLRAEKESGKAAEELGHLKVWRSEIAVEKQNKTGGSSRMWERNSFHITDG